MELKQLREKLMTGTRDAVVDSFDDLLNASSNKIKKTKVISRLLRTWPKFKLIC